MREARWMAVTAVLAASVACGDTDAAIEPALDAIDAAGLAAHTEVLSSDDFEGRAPGSEGERRTVAYLEEEFTRLGLQPGNGDAFTQEVPLVSITTSPLATLTLGDRNLRYGQGFMAWTKRVIDRVALEDSELVFVGYGTVAPEYGWNDYEGLDVAGKTVVMLVNDPGYATGDEDLFNGRSMTYYGRWTYKYEEAARQGAAGALIIHETGAAGYPWDVVSGSWAGPQFGLVADDANLSRVAVEGWITQEEAQALFAAADLDLAEVEEAATRPDFAPIDLGQTASVELTNTIDRSTSHNVMAELRGSSTPDEYVIYMAHWDHLGRDTTLSGDQIYNGALDNASGTAGLLELAEAFTALETPPARSVLFLAVTAEEQGLLGSAYYGSQPVKPLASTVAAINMDGLNIWGPTHDITVVGWGASELDDLIEELATDAGRVVRPDPEPEKGFYYRSDHFSFAKYGVPALYTDAGIDHVEFGEEWGLAQRDDYTTHRYHKPSDEYDPSWDWTGAVDDLRMLFRFGYRLADGATWPNWRSGNEFREIRDAAREGN